MEYKVFEPDIEVLGQTVYAIVDGFVMLKIVPSKILLKEGLGERKSDGMIKLDPKAWYSQEAWLRAFKKIADGAGGPTLHEIGRKIPENAVFPPWVEDVDSAIRSINIAYHMNHRKNGKVMFDPDTGKTTTGIGSYGHERIAGENRILSECKNPYPCEFDHGIITCMATKFEAQAKVTHQGGSCRSKGDESCTYEVTW